nr:hypothetical protein HK105_002204 [Polyrhizophydium stewartii]
MPPPAAPAAHGRSGSNGSGSGGSGGSGGSSNGDGGVKTLPTKSAARRAARAAKGRRGAADSDTAAASAASNTTTVRPPPDGPDEAEAWALLDAANFRPDPQWDDSSSPLMAAASIGLMPAVRLLLRALGDTDGDSANGGARGDQGAGARVRERVNARNRFGTAPLVRAARQGHTDVVRLLLPLVDDVNHANEFGATALLLACGNGHDEMVLLLLRQPGIDVNKSNGHGFTPLMRACGKGFVAIVDALISAGAGPDCPIPLRADAQNEYGASALMLAVDGGHIECVQRLLDSRLALREGCVGEGGHTALTIAASKSLAAIARLILPRLAPADLNHRTASGRCALDFAAGRGCTELVQLLLGLPGVESNCLNGRGMSPLMLASDAGHVDVVRALLAADPRPDPDLVCTHGGNTALLLAVIGGHDEIVAMLAPLCNLDLANEKGDTALMVAARRGNAAVVGRLVSAGATIHLANNLGETALLAAVQAHSAAAVHAMVASGRVGEAANRANTYGVSPLKLACEDGCADIVRALLSLPETDVNTVNWWRETPAMLAARGGHMDCLQALLQARPGGVRLDQCNVDRITALGFALENGFDDIAALLRASGALR